MSDVNEQAVNTIRVLAAEMIQKANSGHPGAPLGTAPMLYELFKDHVRFHPDQANWINRDRFILSGGHGSAGLYALLHLYQQDWISMEDLQEFRQMGSLTPGHPEYSHTPFVEATTGPLGSGFAAAVGMAAAEKHLASVYNRPGYPVFDHYTFVECGDGDVMEGIFQEAASLAGTWNLGKLIVLYDSNDISIEGDTNAVLTENILERMDANGWHVDEVQDGTDLQAINEAIEKAKKANKPSFIKVKNKIGYGSPKEGSASSHGEPLGQDNVVKLKENLGYPYEESFRVSPEVYEYFGELADSKRKHYEDWKVMFDEWSEKYPELKKQLDDMHRDHSLKSLINDNEEFWKIPEKDEATRVSSGRILQLLKDKIPNLVGGSADLGPSNKTIMEGEKDYSATTPEGRNFHFGVRELAMAGISNGLALSGLRPYAATFFVFADYMKPMARLAAMMGLPVTYIFTHDSIGVGEDGPTHQPVEHLVGYRTIPNLKVIRPADATETAAAWQMSLQNTYTPTALVLTRQNVPQVEGTSKEALKGAYIVADAPEGEPECIIIATGSELNLARQAYEELKDEGIYTRVVSMPCMEQFDSQLEDYKEKVLPKHIRNRVVVEAQSDFGWGKYVGLDGDIVAMTGFGLSAPGDELFEHFGFTVENVKNTVKKVIEKNKNLA